MLGWHFVEDTLRDGRDVPGDGVTLVHDGMVKICRSGLHASTRLVDALPYAPGTTICRVDCGGVMAQQQDKFVCRERTILWRIDGGDLLRRFARECALDVIDLWDAPNFVVRYLKTGDDSIREAAADAAVNAVWATAATAARAAATAAAAAARADAAAVAAAVAVADWAAQGAARAAATAAVNAVWATAATAAQAAWVAAAAVAAADAAAAAARADAARADAAKQNRRLTSMVMAERRRLLG